MNSLKIKVSGIKSLTDARYCAGMGVKYLSICFDENGKSTLSPTEFKAIQAWIEGVKWMGEYPGSSEKILSELATSFDLDLWIVSESKFIKNEAYSNLELILAINKPDLDGPELLNAEIEGDISEFNDRLNYEKGIVILKNPYSVSQILSLYETNPNLIFNLTSGHEERPGWMDLSGLQDILEEIEDRGISLF